MTNLNDSIARFHWRTLRTDLADLRGDMDGLALRFRLEYGGSNEAVQRAEQLAGAIQRLEWALARQMPRGLSAAASG